VEAMIRQICEAPRTSLIAQMGLGNISIGLKLLQTQHAKWELSVKGYKELIVKVTAP
jgi:hypothetical protein